jgi:hypothetical protein
MSCRLLQKRRQGGKEESLNLVVIYKYADGAFFVPQRFGFFVLTTLDACDG